LTTSKAIASAHYVVDMMPDFLTLVEDATGQRQTIPCLQIWLDAGYPDAHRDPQLRAYLQHMAQAHGAGDLKRPAVAREDLARAPGEAARRRGHRARHGRAWPVAQD
jgi:hypothetical protein